MEVLGDIPCMPGIFVAGVGLHDLNQIFIKLINN